MVDLGHEEWTSTFDQTLAIFARGQEILRYEIIDGSSSASKLPSKKPNSTKDGPLILAEPVRHECQIGKRYHRSPHHPPMELIRQVYNCRRELTEKKRHGCLLLELNREIIAK